MSEPPVVLWAAAVKRLLHYKDLVPRLERVLGHFSRGDAEEVLQPVRSTLALHKHRG